MFVFGNLLMAIAQILDYLLGALWLIILINVLLSWVRPDPNNPIVVFLDRVTDMVCNPLRRLFPLQFGGFDFAPMAAMLLIWFVRMFLVQTLRDVAIRMR